MTGYEYLGAEHLRWLICQAHLFGDVKGVEVFSLALENILHSESTIHETVVD